MHEPEKIPSLKANAHVALADLSYAIDGRGNAESMGMTALALALNLMHQCGYEGNKLRERIKEMTELHIEKMEEQ